MAIVEDQVHAVYRVTGVENEGLNTAIGSPEYRRFNQARFRRPVRCRRYALTEVESGCVGVRVSGWDGSRTRTPVQRSDDGFFDEIEVNAEPVPQAAVPSPVADWEWAEGTLKMRAHLSKERAAGLSDAKKAQFIQQHGRLFCERCSVDPVKVYGIKAAEACIEVHHRATQVSQMRPGHRTRLSDLQCLCANCHRITHRQLRGAG
ncbi:MAG: hypothetical protein ACJ8AT_33295 [Hyalangium sp.]|uniref:hypothetical protein n=1 Tax=Hyalangium sp. TaxID=2028555 RepID=UPI0038998226